MEVVGKGPINLAMDQSGQAFVYRQYLGRCDRGAYLAAERQAQAQRLGVWVVPGGGLRGPGSSGKGERGNAAQRLSPPRHPQACPSLALRQLNPAGPRPSESRSARLTRPRSCLSRATVSSIAMAMGWFVRGFDELFGGRGFICHGIRGLPMPERMVVKEQGFIDWAVLNQSDITGKLKTRLSLEVGIEPSLNSFPYDDCPG